MQPLGRLDTGVDVERNDTALMRAEPGRQGSLRVRSLVARALTAVLFVAFAALPALPLQAQTVTTLVSNTGQTVNTSGSSHFQAQSFVTGDNTGGYTITEVQIRLRTVTSGDTTTVKIKEDDSGAPGNLVATLTNPATLTSSALNTFTAPANATLDASTPYWISVSEGVSNRVTFASTNGDDETGWSIGNDRQWRASESDSWSSEAASLILVIKGTVNTASTDDATLSALAIEGAIGGESISLSPTFDVDTGAYTASVVNRIDAVTLTATKNDTNATVVITSDDDTSTPGEAELDLSVGANTLTVTVTAEDTTTVLTYTITVTRAAAPPAPTDCPADTTWCTTMTVGYDTVALSLTVAEEFGFLAGSNFGDLGSTMFSHAGSSYTVSQIYRSKRTRKSDSVVQTDSLNLLVSPALPDGTVLQLGSGTFTINAGSGTSTYALEQWDIRANPLNWTAGQHVTVSLKLPAPSEVPADWSLVPTGVGAGDKFRLLFLSSTTRDGSSSDITVYDTFVQERAAAGHTDIQAYSSGFRVVGCTTSINAHVNTESSYASSHKGVPIYWLNGAKAADDYEDFYDGSWDDEANDKNESGDDGPDTSLVANFPLTGCEHDGTEALFSNESRALGESSVRQGRPNSSGSSDGPISSANSTGSTSSLPMYGLSAIFHVVAATTPVVTISADKTSAVLKGDDITYTLTRTGSTTTALPVTVALTQTGDFLAAAELTKMVTIAAGQSTQTFTAAAAIFQDFAPGATVEGGTLTAAVQAGTDYVLGTPASVDVDIVVRLTIGFEMASYSIAEEAGSLAVKLVARTGAGALAPDADVDISFYTAELDPLEARIVHDYESVSVTVTFAPSDFSADGSVFKAEKTASVTIVDDEIDEQAEGFAVLLDITPGLLREYDNFVDTNGAACPDPLCPALVTIIDTDPASADITGIEITSRPANGVSYLEGEAITVAVTYDQAVAVDTTSGTPTLDLEIDVAQAASYTSISSDNLALTFSYTVAGDDQDQNGIAILAGSIDINGGAITGQGTSAAANLVYPRIGKDATQKVNTDPKVISGGVAVTSSPTAKTDTYGASETIRFTVTFDSPVAVDTTSGTPVLGFRLANTGANPANKDLDYVSGSGTAVLTFEYVVQSGDTDTNGISVRNNWLDANGGANGAITHATTGRDAKLNHDRPGNNGNFPGHKVDGSLGPSVADDWVLKPSGLGGGEQFRLIFFTSLSHVGSDTDIEVYNTWVQGVAGGGHAAIQAYGAAFNAVGCTASTDARDNTHTTYTSSNKGVPIYWLNGAKVADEYEDFYDGSWDDEANDKNQLGFNGLDTSNVTNYPWTGCDDDGTKSTGMALGDTTPRVGRPNSTDTGNGPIGSVTTKSNVDHRPMYGLSAVFTVMTDTEAPGAPTGLTANADGPEEIDLSWTAPSSIGGDAITGYKIEFSINGGTTWSDLVADTGATDTKHSHRSNLSAGDTRHYRVSAINPGGAGLASNVAFATTAATDVLVSNTGQNGEPADRQSIGDQDKTHSQGFETGSNPAGYSLASVEVYVSDADLAAGETFTVHIYTADGSGGLDALAYTLTSPNTYKNNDVNKFTAPGGATLAAGAAYHVVFQATGNAASDFVLGVTSSNKQDTGSELRWTIEDARRFEGSPSSAGTNYKVSVNGTARPTLIPSDWSLIPTGLSASDKFRLIFISSSSTRRDAVPTDIADYNTFVQGLAAAGHTDIQAYSAGFSVVGCTADTDARDNTGTTGTGVSIYWLNGDPDNAKVADDYDDFYDGEWDEERPNQNRDESGNSGPNTSNTLYRPFTGCKHNGTERFSMGNSFALGASNVVAGRPNSSAATDGPIGSNTTVPRSAPRPFYGLSTVFQVASSALPDVPTRLMATAVGQTQIDLYWIAPASNNGLAVTSYRIEVSSNGGVSWTDLVSDTNSDATAYSHTGLSAGATRTYRVSAINPTGFGNPSGTAFAITALAQVMGLMVEPGDMQLVVNWTAVDNATGYKVQWKSGVQDYNTGDRQAVIPLGSTTTYTIPNLTNGTEYTVQVIATRTGANDGPPSMETPETPAAPMAAELSLAPVNPRVNETDGTVAFTVTLSPASSGTVTVDYATSDIIADAGMDYTATSGTLTFMPGETLKTITITILNDTVYETLERFEVSLSNPTGAALSTASLANVTIANDDAVPTASMADVIVNEDAGTMTMTLALSHESSLAVTYETTASAVSGTATSPNDYLNFLQGALTTITVPAGDMSATFNITIVDDMVGESDETIIITWMRSPGINAEPTSFTFTGTITDNDRTGVSVSRTALTVTEEDTTGDSYTVVLNTQPTADVTVTVAGHAGTDVTLTPDPPTLAFTSMNWDTPQTVTVIAVNDADTTDDTVTLTHSAASTDTNYDGITIAVVTVTVNDNDTTRPPPPPPPRTDGGGGGASSNRSPSFTEGDATTRTVAENTAAGQDIGAPLEAVDRDRRDTLTYTLEGDDAESFDIDAATGQLRSKAPLDYETRTSYTLTARVADRRGSWDAMKVTVTVTNVGLSGTVGRYDRDDNGTIDRDEAIAAVVDYFNGVISKEEAIEVVRVYFAG